MLGAVDWSSLTIAGAFILGAVLSAVAMLRIVRAVIELLDPSRSPRRRRPRSDDAEEP